jgi:hypothetical protein
MKEEKIIKFDGDNYEEFEMNLFDHLKSKKLYKSIRSERPGKGEDGQDQWDKIDKAAQRKIGERILPKFRSLIKGATAKQMLDELKNIDEGNQVTLMVTRRRLFQTIKCNDKDDIREYLNELERCQKKLEKTDSKIGDVELVMKVCETLPQSWEATLAALQTQTEIMNNYTKFSAFITNEYLRRRSRVSTNEEKKSAFQAKKQNFKGKCYNCDKLGHKKSDCWASGGDKEGQGPHQKKTNVARRNIFSF